jgi:hypothetical protein
VRELSLIPKGGSLRSQYICREKLGKQYDGTKTENRGFQNSTVNTLGNAKDAECSLDRTASAVGAKIERDSETLIGHGEEAKAYLVAGTLALQYLREILARRVLSECI